MINSIFGTEKKAPPCGAITALRSNHRLAGRALSRANGEKEKPAGSARGKATGASKKRKPLAEYGALLPNIAEYGALFSFTTSLLDSEPFSYCYPTSFYRNVNTNGNYSYKGRSILKRRNLHAEV